MTLPRLPLRATFAVFALLASTAVAQEEETEGEETQWREVTPPPTEQPAPEEDVDEGEAEAPPVVRPRPAPRPSVEPERADPTVSARRPLDPGLRVLREAGVGALGMVGGGALGALAGTGLACAANYSSGWCVLIGLLFGTTVGGTVGAGLGVWLGGDEHGAWWASMGGAILGTAVGLYGMSAMPIAQLLYLTFPVLGALLFNEMARAFSAPTATPPPSGAVRSRSFMFTPFTTPHGGGGLAVVGLF